MPAEITIPTSIDAVIAKFDTSTSPFDLHEVQSALGKARGELVEPKPSDNYGTWAEILGFTVTKSSNSQNPWSTYFGPMGSETDKDGKEIFFPDISDADGSVISHWEKRALEVKNPILKARYSDLVWEMAPLIAGAKRKPEMARLAIDSYLDSRPLQKDFHDTVEAILRAFDLSVLLGDEARITTAKEILISVFNESIAEDRGFWWDIFRRLTTAKTTIVSTAEKDGLAAELEKLSATYSDEAANKFDPHALQNVARYLIRFYGKHGKFTDVRRLNKAIARAFEIAAEKVSAMVGASWLQTAVNAYRRAGLKEESARARVRMQEKINASHDEMKKFSTEIEISFEDMERFLTEVVVEKIPESFARIGFEFLPRKRLLEKQIEELAVRAPLMALMSQQIMSEDHVTAIIGSVSDDPQGRLIRQSVQDLSFKLVWLDRALDRVIEKHELLPEHFVGWANRSGIFQDTTFLMEGVQAWYEGDYVKAAHVLVPQIEVALREVARSLGRPITKAHPSVAHASVMVGMGEFLYTKEVAEILGPDLILFFQSVYADPRGFNWRNIVAHGMIKPSDIDVGVIQIFILTLIILGLWKDIARKHVRTKIVALIKVGKK